MQFFEFLQRHLGLDTCTPIDINMKYEIITPPIETPFHVQALQQRLASQTPLSEWIELP